MILKVNEVLKGDFRKYKFFEEFKRVLKFTKILKTKNYIKELDKAISMIAEDRNLSFDSEQFKQIEENTYRIGDINRNDFQIDIQILGV